ncbi:Uncharacterised protein [uncultured archaeon]|nr:Uncharacterised protein [uncultured archaeon]
MKNRFRVFLSLTLIYGLFIFYLSSRSSLGDPLSVFDFLHLRSLESLLESIKHSDLKYLLYPFYIFSVYPDKVEHIILYAGFGFLLSFTLKNCSNPLVRNHALIFAVIIGTIYGASDEFHQSFVPGRTASIGDLLADSIGILIAQAIVSIKERLPVSSKKKRPPSLDLKLAFLLIASSILFILVPPFNQTFLRIILALPLLLFLPGYLFIHVMFPRKGELSAIERFTLSIGLSIAIFVFDGFALNYTKWGFRPNSIVLSLSIIMVLLLTIAYFQRLSLKETGYSFSYSDISSFLGTLRSNKPESGSEYDPALEKTLIKTMVIAILLVSAMLIYAKVTREPEKFSALYILGSNGKAEDYPANIRIGEPASILVGVENYEYAHVNYTLRVQLGGVDLKEEDIALDHNDKWLNNVTFVPRITSSIAFSNRSKLEFLLSKDNETYRSVHLWVNISMDSVKFAELPELENGDMESDLGWGFSGSSPDITGSYKNNISSSRVYEINFTTKEEGSYGTIFQNLTTYGNARAILSFDMRDSEYSNASDFVFKQVLLDDQMIWETGIGGKNSTWEHVELPLMLSGNNTLAFRVYSKYNNSLSAMVWIDNIRLNPYGAPAKNETIINPYRETYEFNFDVRGAPLKLEKSMEINGFNFPGFSYDINENRSYEKLELEIPDFNIIDTGKAIYTARMKGSDLHLMGKSYKILGKSNVTNLSRELEIPQDKILSLGETWTFGVYSLSIKLISSKEDSAMLELRKDGKILDSKLVNERGVYEYRTTAKKISFTIFKAKVDSVSGDNVHLTNIELYSDSIEVLRPGTITGDFEVTNISSDEITFENIYPIELKDGMVILNGSMGLKLQGDKVYPYASGAPFRGSPQYIYAGRWMNITGFNYPGFYMDNDNSYEDLRMYFSGSGFVEKGQAVYLTKVHSGYLSFLGNTYEADSNRPGYISTVRINKNLTLYDNSTRELEGYMLSFQKMNADLIKIHIRKFGTIEKQELLNETIKSNTTFFPDISYEIFAGRSGNLRKSNTLSTGDTFEYWEEYREDMYYKAIAGELKAINNNSIELDIRIYEFPFKVYPGGTYGDFEIESLTLDAITMRNTKPLQFIPGSETSILNGTLRIRTSSNESLAYPVR